MKLDTTRLNTLGVMGAIALGQVETPAVTPAAGAMSYDEAWQKVNEYCAGLIGRDRCISLLGYTPFVCPPPVSWMQKPISSQWWFWFGLGIAGGVVYNKFVKK